MLQSVAGSRPQVAAFLEHMQPAQTSTGQSVTFTVDGVTHTVPIGSLTGSSTLELETTRRRRASITVLIEPHADGPVLLGHTPKDAGSGQVTPGGLTSLIKSNQHSMNMWLNSIIGQKCPTSSAAHGRTSAR